MRLVGCAALLLLAQDPVPRTTLELPAGPAQRALIGLGADLGGRPIDLSASFAFGALDDSRTWVAWAEAWRAERASPSAARRAELCLFALRSDRSDDAWEHWAESAREPALARALLPLFMPGIEPELWRSSALLRDLEAVFPGGIELRPALPPASVQAAEIELGKTWLERRSAKASSLRVGSATLDLVVALESDGLQIDLTLVSGGPCKLSMAVPEPPDFELFVTYADWFKRDDPLGAVELVFDAESPAHTLFGRYSPRRMTWPTSLPEQSWTALERDGLRFEGATSEFLPRAQAVLEGLGRLLGCRIHAPDAQPTGTPVVVRFEAGATRANQVKLATIVSQAERWFARRGAR